MERIMKKNKIFSMGVALAIGAGATFTSCVDTDSNLVDFGSALNTPNDTVYSLLGVLNKMQAIADRTIILGEVKGDMTSLTDAATTDLQEIANFTAGTDNPYNRPEDYYAIIQNCNYYIAHADTNMTLRGEKVFIREYAAVKAFRAWTYLQLAINYGKVPFYTKPLMTEAEADPSLYPKYDVQQIAEYFIPDLAPYVETDLPSVETDALETRDRGSSYIPVRVVLGDLCLWAGRYREAAQYYHDYVTHVDNPQPVSERSRETWPNSDFLASFGISPSYFSSITSIRMEMEEYNGVASSLADIFTSTSDNYYYYQASASPALEELSRSQRYVMETTRTSGAGTIVPEDTISPSPDHEYYDENQKGDLRLVTTLSTSYSTAMGDSYSSVQVTNGKLTEVDGDPYYPVSLYRILTVYLRMAEAYNRAGLPESAFAILKYGLSNTTVANYINQGERDRAGNLLVWDPAYFVTHDMVSTTLGETTWGIHAVGSGDTRCDTLYAIPDDLTTQEDSILFVENLICDEMALEQTFDGTRFGDLQRIALRRNDPAFLADKVARRKGSSVPRDEELYNRLLDKDNWYLPLE